MPEQIRQHARLGAHIQLPRCVRVSQDVAAHVLLFDAGDLGVLAQDVSHRRRRSESLKRHPQLYKQMPGWRLRRAPAPKVPSQGLGNGR